MAHDALVDFPSSGRELVEHSGEQHTVYTTPWFLPKHKIFISHSGRQKDFAEQLCKDLETHGYYPFFDKYSDSLPKGERFPPLIFKAAKECLLAIVLISEDFLTKTKWPMLELAAFVQAQKTREDLCILPVLLDLTIEDLLNTEKWSESWMEWGKKEQRLTSDVIIEWKDAVQALKSVNMILKRSYDGEVKLREAIVKSIYEKMPPDIRSDVMHVQGKECLCKEVCSMFDKIPASTSRLCENAKVLGVYGIGGAGKTTLCMIITEHMRSEFFGRVCVVEFGKETSIVDLQRQVLRQLCRDNRDYLEDIRTENEGLNRLTERICRERVFLALDNVSDDVASIMTAKSFLKLAFHPNSMVLVTSRSVDVLCRYLGIPEGSCISCPSISRVDALQILLEQVNLPLELLDTEQTQILHCAVTLSFFKGYHPLALILFAAQLGTDKSKWTEIKLDLQWKTDQEHPLFSKIKANYMRLPYQCDRDMFMDIALFTPQLLRGINDIICWLSDTINLDVDDIKQKLGILKVKSLLEKWKMEDQTFRIHDLYRMFAEQNANVDPRYIYQRGGIHLTKVLQGKVRRRARVEVERAAFVEVMFDMLVLEEYTNLEVLSMRRCEKLRALFIRTLGCLVSLEVAECRILECLDLSGLINLRWLHVSSCEELMKLDASEAECLRHVSVSECSKLEDLNMRNCHMMKSVSIKHCHRLRRVNLGSGLSMECLELCWCLALTDVEISGIAYLTTIKKELCPQVRAIQGGHIMCTKDCQYISLEEWGMLPPTFLKALEIAASLQVLHIESSCISRLPDLRACLSLQKLVLRDMDVLLGSMNEEILEEREKITFISAEDVGLPISLEVIEIESCRNVVVKEILWKVQGLRNLRELTVADVRMQWEDARDPPEPCFVWNWVLTVKQLEMKKKLQDIAGWDSVCNSENLSLPLTQCSRLGYLWIDNCRLANPIGQLSGEWNYEIIKDEYSQGMLFCRRHFRCNQMIERKLRRSRPCPSPQKSFNGRPGILHKSTLPRRQVVGPGFNKNLFSNP